MHRLDWSRLRYILAVVQAGSAAAAARQLGVNHSTIVRHIQQFEQQQQIRVFDHLPSGYRLTEQGAAFLEAAQQIDHAVTKLERKIQGEEQALSGTITLTTTDSLQSMVIEAVTAFQRQHTGVHIEWLITNQQLNLNTMEADIAIRPTNKPPENLISRRIGQLEFGVYGSTDVVKKYPAIDQAPWVGFSEPFAQNGPAQWLKKNIQADKVVTRCNSFVMAQKLVEQGIGYGVLVSQLADTSPVLQKMENNTEVKLWLLTHEDMLRSRKIVACLDFLQKELA